MSSSFGKGWPIRMIRFFCQKFVALNCPLYNRGIFQKMRITINCHQSLLSLKKRQWQKAVKVLSGLPPTHFFLFYRTQDPGLRMSVTDSLTNLFNERLSILQPDDKEGYRMLRHYNKHFESLLLQQCVVLLFCEFELMQEREERWRLFATREKM